MSGWQRNSSPEGNEQEEDRARAEAANTATRRRPEAVGSHSAWPMAAASQDQSQSAYHQSEHEEPQDQDNCYAQSSRLDLEADGLYGDAHESITRAINSTFHMPLSEHVLYSSYESYDNIMIEQRRMLDDMMSKLSECSDKHSAAHQQQQSYNLASSSLVADPNDPRTTRIDYNAIENLRDKYDSIHDFNEQMFDQIGQNLDDAAGLTSRNAQLVQATLQSAGSRNRMPAQFVQQNDSGRNLSSSSLTKSNEHYQHQTAPGGQTSSNANHGVQTPPNSRFRYRKAPQKVSHNQVNSVVQSTSMQQQQPQAQQQLQSRNQYGGYFGKQQFGSPNQRFATLENKNIPRPQNFFKQKIDNSYRPFEPLIKYKPNASTPLRLTVERDEHGNEFYSHPYEYEIRKFPIKSELMIPSASIRPPRVETTPILKVENVQQLEEMCRHIEAQKEFAVDVEHHSYRSFQGITCLLQISTRTQDFVIDAIKLRDELHRLNESFTNPNIVKVFHGADCDILWLQRDFGVYVVNLFDTSRAAKLMKFAHLSLAFLMKHYCDEDPDKSYQLADWRERPLPLPMLNYARNDTHHLLFIYDELRNDLLTKAGQNKGMGQDLLRSVFERGREICMKRYEKPPFSDTSHLSILRKSRSTFNAKQMFAFKELYAWRDKISRELDESVGYVLPNNLMIRIAEYLPREPQGITALCNPMPPTVKKYLSDIHAIILKAIDVPLDETSKVITGSQLNVDPYLRSIDLDSISHKQDIAHSGGLHENSMPNLLDKMHLLNCSNDEKSIGLNGCNNDYSNGGKYDNLQRKVNQSPSRLYNFLDASWSKNDGSHNNRPNDSMRAGVHDSIQKQFKSPYHRYVASNKNT